MGKEGERSPPQLRRHVRTHTNTSTYRSPVFPSNTKPEVTAVISSPSGAGRGNRNRLHLSQRMSQMFWRASDGSSRRG